MQRGNAEIDKDGADLPGIYIRIDAANVVASKGSGVEDWDKRCGDCGGHGEYVDYCQCWLRMMEGKEITERDVPSTKRTRLFNQICTFLNVSCPIRFAQMAQKSIYARTEN